MSLLALPLIASSACSQPPRPALTENAKRARIEAMYQEYRRDDFPDLPEVTVAGLDDLERRGALVLVDVRSAEEREVSMIPGAIVADELPTDPARLAGKVVVAYCTIGYRSGLYAAGLRRRGIDARNLVGGILAWTYTGRPLVTASGPTRRVHVYGAKWDLAAAGYEAVW